MANFRHIPCAPCVNESERIAIECLRARLNNVPSGPWILLSNLNHSVSSQRRSDEIDGVLIGPPGVVVIEVKHWDQEYLKRGVEDAADLLNSKAKRIRGKIPSDIDPGFVEGRFLLTRGQLHLAKHSPVRGIRFFGLPESAELASTSAPTRLSANEIERIAKAMEPRASVALNGDLRRFGSLINLERLTPKSDAFHRIYRGEHATRREKVLLHLYDLSASDDKNSLEKARREFDVIQRWQKSTYMPGLLDSFQEAEGYPGEMYFFSLPDPIAPTLEQRRKDPTWSQDERLRYAIDAARALAAFHRPEDSSEALCLRRISPSSLRVQQHKGVGIPLFTDFSLTRIANSQTVSTQVQIDLGDLAPYAAPEIHKGGFSAADARSDVYSLCASLLPVFLDEDEVRGVLEQGLIDNPEGRPSAHELAEILDALLSNVAPEKNLPEAPLPTPDYWDNNTVVPFQGSLYRILERLGKGGIGWTFKVCELDKNREETYGTYVAKTIRYEKDAETALRAYRRVRDKTDVPTLSSLKEVAPKWQENSFVALLRWVDGMTLYDLREGLLTLYAEELGETTTEDMLLRWLLGLTDGLAALHTKGLIHGDVSPKNILTQQGLVVLTDYDTVAGIDEKPTSGPKGNPIYTSPSREKGWPYAASDDIFALAASFFHILFDRDPFERGAVREKGLGLNWEGVDITGYERLQVFLERATRPAGDRLPDASASHTLLRQLMDAPKGQLFSLEADDPKSDDVEQDEVIRSAFTSGPHQTIWLNHLLATYPGSRHGNAETRGLDSPFAAATYVETDLDHALREKIEQAQVELVILFGNAGDGKTAFLQHLLQGLGVPPDKLHSSNRIIRHSLQDKRKLLVNLDGSASWNGKSANELLDMVFNPFLTGEIRRDLVHVVAVNSGKLMEWIDWKEENTSATPLLLLEQVRGALQGEQDALNKRHVLIDLNNRSLVGAVDISQSQPITTRFLDLLLDRMLGKEETQDPWAVCSTCTARDRCTASNSIQRLRDVQQGQFIRDQLKVALQTSHQRGDIHITARELRATLSYIFFGVHDCQELHDAPGIRPEDFSSRAFDANSPQRQGELLDELVRFDPALESHPAVDRWLKKVDDFAGLDLISARRLAWFTVSPDNLPDRDGLNLYQGRSLDRFRRVPFMEAAEKDALLRELCQGIARLEDLPQEAFERMDGVPLKVTPRTPIESAFWVVKPQSHFHLDAPLHRNEGLEVLHTHLHLTYTPAKGQPETLRIGLELFHLLLDLAAGVQLVGSCQEGVFANLEIFTQRLAQEDARELHAWHPSRQGSADCIKVIRRDKQQWLVREALT